MLPAKKRTLQLLHCHYTSPIATLCTCSRANFKQNSINILTGLIYCHEGPLHRKNALVNHPGGNPPPVIQDVPILRHRITYSTASKSFRSQNTSSSACVKLCFRWLILPRAVSSRNRKLTNPVSSSSKTPLSYQSWLLLFQLVLRAHGLRRSCFCVHLCWPTVDD